MGNKNIIDNVLLDDSEITQSALSKFIKCKRVEKGLSLVQLSELTDMDFCNTYICKMETNKTKINKKQFEKIIEALNIDEKDLDKFFKTLNKSLEYIVVKDYEEGNNDIIRQIIYHSRIKKRLSREELAKLSEVSVPTIEDIEDGYTNSRVTTLIKIFQTIKVSYEDYKDIKESFANGKLKRYIPPTYEPTIESKVISYMRNKRKIDRCTLSKLANIDLKVLIKIEVGKTKKPSQNTLNKIYNVLGITNENIDSILNEIGESTTI